MESSQSLIYIMSTHNIPIENISIDKQGINLTIQGRQFRVWYKYFPEFLEAPLRCIFDVRFCSWSMAAEPDAVVWHDEDSFHWPELEMDIHARNLFDQSLNEGRGVGRPAPFTTKICYAAWTARGKESR